MPTNYTAPVGAPCWIDLMTSDQAASVAFYTQLLGWDAEDPNPEFGGYLNFTKHGAPIAGCMQSEHGAGMPDVWSVYLATDDAAKTVEAAAENGGEVIVPPMAVGDLGTMAVLTDAGGAAIGLWEPNTFGGFQEWGELDTPGWFELHTRDHAASIAFYRDVFRWDAHDVGDTDDFRYTTLGEGDDQLAGVMDASAWLPEGVPAHWSVYFRVASTDATIARVTELGGSVVQPAEDTPYGRLATLTDPTGAPFKLVGDS